MPSATASSTACAHGIKPLVTLSHYEMPHALVSVGTGEMRKRYGFIHVDKYDDGTGTYERRRKDSSSPTRRSSSPTVPRAWLN